MSSEHCEKSEFDREQRLFEILANYFAAVEAGENPDRTKWLAQYPEWAEEIVQFIGDQDRLLKITAPLRPMADACNDSESDPARRCCALTVGQASQTIPATEPQNDSAAYQTGTRVRYIGDYELVGEIARGGMGVVFRARQRSLNRPVALKMLLAGAILSAEDEQRFRQEAEAAANLDHPNIVPIFEVGRHDGYSYFSMKLIEGSSLAQRLLDFSDDQRAAAKLVAIVARAVHHAHQRGVLHRDLKPSNILLGGGPETPIGQLEPHITDFGLAKRVEGDPGLTQSGAILGTPSYMAPEQASGKKDKVTVATDVYGLGAVLYAILSGKPPFHGDSALETLAQVRDRTLDPPSSHGRRIDRDLETICLKCLEKEPSRRYSSAEEVADDLERWLASVPILARATGRAERAWRWCRRKPVAAALVATSILLFFAIIAGLLMDKRGRQAAERLKLEVDRRASAVLRREFVRDVKQASELLNENRRSSAIELLARHHLPPGEEDLRGFAWHYLWKSAHLESSPLQGHEGEVYSVTFSPDGTTLATAGKDRTIHKWDVNERRTCLILPDRTHAADGHTDDINWVTFSPDGKSLATASDDQTVKLWDAASGRLRSTLTGHNDRVVAVLFAHKGEHLISCSRSGKVILWDVATSRERSTFAVSNGYIQSLAVSPDGSILAIAGQRVVIWDLPGGRAITRFGGSAVQINSVAFSHDGKTLASGSSDGKVTLWDAEGTQSKVLLPEHRAAVESVAFAPDDRTLASADGFGITHLCDTSSGAYDTIATGQDRIWCVAFSVDGQILATASQDSTVRLWDSARTRARTTIPVLHNWSMAFSGSGTTIAVVEEEGTIRTYEATRGSLVATKRLGASVPFVAFALSCDATRLVTLQRDQTITIWDFEGGRPIQNFTASSSHFDRVYISHGGRYVAIGDKTGALIVRDTVSGSSQQFVTDGGVPLKFSSNGKSLASVSWGGPCPTLWDTATGQSHSMKGPGHKPGTRAVAFSADGQTIATGGGDQAIILWDCRSQQAVARFFGHTGDVCAVEFSPCGTILASGAADRTVRLWDVPSQQELATLRGHSGTVRQIAFSPDGRILATLAESAKNGWEIFLWSAGAREQVD